MSSKVIKLIIVTDLDTADMIDRLASLPSIKDREAAKDRFLYVDPNGMEHELHYILSEEV